LINGGSPGKRKPRKDSGVTDSSITNRTTELKKKKDNVRHKRYQRRYKNNSQRKYKVQKAHKSKHPANSGHSEKSKCKNK
jgi:hypothetical protein